VSAISNTNVRRAAALPVHHERDCACHKPAGRRKQRSRDQTRSFMISLTEAKPR
jgi:hypothetical protein